MSHAIDVFRWYSGFVGWSSLIRLRHVTSGLYLAVIGDENGRNKLEKKMYFFENGISGPKVTCISKKNASAIAVTFEMKMSKVCYNAIRAENLTDIELIRKNKQKK